jgi:hypothetical protein
LHPCRGALVLGSVAAAGTAHGENTGPVPDEWGDPTVEFAQLQVVGRDNGRIPGRLGNQHVIEVNTYDEDSVLAGSVLDWRCPAGVVAPVYGFEATSCRLKAQRWIDYDYARPDLYAENWAPNLRYVNFRLPIVLLDSTNAVVGHSQLSLHLKADGALSQVWSDGDYLDLLFRQGAHVTGGKFMGKPWLNMDSVEVTDNQMWLLRYYDPA